MLVDKALIETLPFGGMMTVSKPGIPLFALQLGTPHVIGSFADWHPGILPTDTLLLQWLISIQAIFWPLLGILLAIFLNRHSPSGPGERVSIYVSAGIFFAGLAIVLPFVIYGAKWEISRFMLPGYYVGSIWLMIGIKQLSEDKQFTATKRAMSIGIGMAILVLIYGANPKIQSGLIMACAFLVVTIKQSSEKDFEATKRLMSGLAIGMLTLVLIYGPVRSIKDGLMMVPTRQAKWLRIQTVLHFNRLVP